MKLANYNILGLFLLVMLNGCVVLLPSSKEVVLVPWESFQEIKGAYEKVVRNETTLPQLKEAGFDIQTTPNVKILNYIDIAATTQNIHYNDLSEGLARCIKVRENCMGYQMEPMVTLYERQGNFWLDIFNFKRVTKGTGWRFKAVFLVIDNVVVEKFWDGDPKIVLNRETKNPLGPFQEAGSLILRVVP